MHNAVPDRVHGTWGGLCIDMNTRTCFVVFCVAVAVAGNTSLPKAQLEFVEGQRDRKRHNWNMPLLNSQEVFVQYPASSTLDVVLPRKCNGGVCVGLPLLYVAPEGHCVPGIIQMWQVLQAQCSNTCTRCTWGTRRACLSQGHRPTFVLQRFGRHAPLALNAPEKSSCG